MTKILPAVLCMLAATITNAQSQFGIINYTLPEGWYARKSGNDIVLERKDAENGDCSITLFQEVNGVVNTEKNYAELWRSKTKSGSAGIAKTTSAIKTEGEGWISFSGSIKTGKSTSASTEGFYTLSNERKTVMILAQANDACIDEIDKIIASIHISEKASSPQTKARKKTMSKTVLKSLREASRTL